MATMLVNGKPRDLDDVPVHTNVLDFIRGCGLTGVKEGCAEGECGACAVMVARPALDGSNTTEWTAINSCLVPAVAPQEVVTSEGIGTPDALHPVQREIMVRGGSQCGYCTPGFVCSMAAEFYRSGRARTNGAGPCDEHHGENGFNLHSISGNLCRCTGYRPIRDAAYALDFPTAGDAIADRRTKPAPAPAKTRLGDGDAEYIRPGSLTEAIQLIHDREDAIIVAGSTDWGVDVNLRGRRAGLMVAIDRLPELREFSMTTKPPKRRFARWRRSPPSRAVRGPARPLTRPPTSWPARAPRCPTSVPAPTTGPRCWDRRSASCSRR
jgi:xanthine dehydrogenase small subunit